MKKLLLTLGSAASVAAPLMTVIACGEDSKATVPAAIETSITAIEKLEFTSGVTSTTAGDVKDGTITQAEVVSELGIDQTQLTMVIDALEEGVELVGLSWDSEEKEITVELAEEVEGADAATLEDVKTWDATIDSFTWAEDLPLQINGKDFIPTEDGAYLMADYYDGKLFDEGAEFTGEILEINEYDWMSSEPQATDIGEDDSIIVVYDEDDSDGFNINNFEDTFAFYDSNVFYSEKLVDKNVEMFDNKKHFTESEYGDYYSLITTFSDGKLNEYIGASYNTGVSTEASLSTLKASMSKENYEALLEGLYFVEEADGTYTDADGFVLDDGSFAYYRGQEAMSVPTPLFEYEKIAKNAMKITYVQEDNAFKQDASSFGFVTEHDTEDGSYTIDVKLGELYLGEETWSKKEGASSVQGSKTL